GRRGDAQAGEGFCLAARDSPAAFSLVVEKRVFQGRLGLAGFGGFLMPSRSLASARKRISSASLGLCLSIHCTALSYHSRASFFSPSCQWAIARKKKSKLSPPWRSGMAFCNAVIAAFQSPAL